MAGNLALRQHQITLSASPNNVLIPVNRPALTDKLPFAH
jgi:hypothetical protein